MLMTRPKAWGDTQCVRTGRVGLMPYWSVDILIISLDTTPD